MDTLAMYHRSLLDMTKYARPAFQRQDPLISSQFEPRRPVPGSFQGFQFNPPDGLQAMDLSMKPGQDFKKYATEWESRCSALVKGQSAGNFAPVVGPAMIIAGYPVIAHRGEVWASRVIVPREYAYKMAFDTKRLGQLLAQDVPAYVTNVGYPDVGNWGTLERDNSTRFSVLVDIYGKVLISLGGRTRDDSIEEVDPFLYLGVAALLADLGATVGRKLVMALVKQLAEGAAKKVTKEAAKDVAKKGLTALEKARLAWGEADVMSGGVARGVASELEVAKATMKKALPEILDGTINRLSAKTFRDLHRAMTKAGFKLIRREPFGPEGGEQLFYQNGNVLARFKTMGDKAGPRMGQPHMSFALNDGKGLQWMNDMGKFTSEGKVAAKAISDASKFNPAADFQGNPHRFQVVESNFNLTAVDSWANSTHFNAPPGFKLDGLADLPK